jgi:hypothetical protein
MCSMNRCKAYLCFGILISLILITSSFAQKKKKYSVWGEETKMGITCLHIQVETSIRAKQAVR